MKKLMFDVGDIERPLPILMRLLRIIFFKEEVTNDDFIQKHTDHYERSGWDPITQNHDRNNLRRTLIDNDEEADPRKKIKLTWNIFSKTIESVFHRNIVRITITLKDPKTGEVKEYSSDEQLIPPEQKAPF
jgi:hypothetical protein